MFLFKILGVLFALFVVIFVAITVEESFLGGRRRRRLEQKARAAQQEAHRTQGNSEDPSEKG